MTIGNAGRDFLCHLVMLPVLEFLMTSPRVTGRQSGGKQRGVMIAAGVLIAASAVKIGMELTFKEQSLYDLMDVPPDAPATELKKGYKRASLKVHPDKLQASAGSVEADEEGNDDAFLALKAAYDVLSDSYQRDLYNKFGKEGLSAKDDTTALLAGVGFFYIISLMLAYMLTRRRTVSRAQTWAFSGLLALAIFEYQARILSFDFLQELLPQLAMFEKIELLHRLYPAYLLGARMVAWLFFEDTDAYNFVMLQQLHWKADRLKERLAMMNGAPRPDAALPLAPVLPGVPGGVVTPQHWHELARSNATAPAKVDTNTASTGAVTGTGAVAGTGTGAPAAGGETPAQPQSPTLAGGMAAVPSSPTKQPAPASGGGGRNLGGLVWFFGVYFFFQWLVGRGS